MKHYSQAKVLQFHYPYYGFHLVGTDKEMIFATGWMTFPEAKDAMQKIIRALNIKKVAYEPPKRITIPN